MRTWFVAMLLVALPVSAQGQVPEVSDRCFDLAVVARLDSQIPGPFPDVGPDEIVIRWPWTLKFLAERVIIGQEARRRISVTDSLHAHFNHQIQHFLLFLRRNSAGDYAAVDIASEVIRDERAEFIIPFEQPYDAEDLRPNGWLPEGYEQYLRPIRYRARDAWWLVDPYSEPDDPPVAPGWQTRRGNVVVATRGLYVSDLKRMFANEPNAVCVR